MKTESNEERNQKFYAKIAGIVYLYLIIAFMGGVIIISQITTSADFAEKISQATASETLYRIALSIQMTAPVCTVLLAYALYVLVKPINERLAQLALFWRLGEAFLGSIHIATDFLILRLYTTQDYAAIFTLDQLQAIDSIISHTGGIFFIISTLFFSIGSIVFFYLFYISRFIPKFISLLGIFASVLVTITAFASFIFPTYSDIIEFGWLPMFISEITTAFWLIFKGAKIKSKEFTEKESEIYHGDITEAIDIDHH